MGFKHANGIAAAQDGGEVVGFVHVLNQHAEVGHALVQHRTQPLETTGKDGHGASFSVLRVWDAALGHIQTHGEAGSVIDDLLGFRRMEVLLPLP
jgi:hypothetical protein